jgi:hypothetical protein
MTATKYQTEFGPCPRCDGTGGMPVPEDWNYKTTVYGYDATNDTVPCRNCGGQTMSGHGTGKVPLRASGEPCLHEYSGGKAGNCYYSYRCKHCVHSYSIDSGG